MEKLHLADERIWIGKPINLKKYLENWAEIHEFSKPYETLDIPSDFNEAMKKSIKLEDNLFKTLEDDCSPHHLDCPEENYIDFEKSLIPDDTGLQVLEYQKADVERRKKDNKYRIKVKIGFKQYNYPKILKTLNDTTKERIKLSHQNFWYNEICLLVQIYRPTMQYQHAHYQHQRAVTLFTVDQEMYVYGNQYLHELRDVICCVSDIAVAGDFSEDPDKPQKPRAFDLYKSGFFYIGNTFYNDMREPDNIDYSIEITEWMKEQNLDTPKKALMEQTKFIDLEIRLGYPYLYMHQGHCEHLIAFTDLRLIHPSDPPPTSENYPLNVPQPPKRRIPCCVCGAYTAKWVVKGNKLLLEDPSFFCDTCFRAFHYDRNGKKIGDFKAQPYFDRSAIL